MVCMQCVSYVTYPETRLVSSATENYTSDKILQLKMHKTSSH